MALPEEDREVFHRLAFGQLMVTFDQDHGLEAVEKIRDYVIQLVAWRREYGDDKDFVTALATHEIDGKPLDLEVIISFFPSAYERWRRDKL